MVKAYTIKGKRMPASKKVIKNEYEVIEIRDITIQRLKGNDAKEGIVAIKYGPKNTPGPIITLGQKVFASGRYRVKKGTMGIVIQLDLPYENGTTSDIIDVWFENFISSSLMKFEDLKIDKMPFGLLS